VCWSLLDVVTGNESWRLALENPEVGVFNGAVIGDNGYLYVSSYEHLPFAFDLNAV
jgi:hypothetical protein